ncbi:thioredoxin [Synergistales bacterium]|nr:thioredoxin [Synergistales bacterium]GHV53869.1 thioredoxin [Synergistales bacterium]
MNDGELIKRINSSDDLWLIEFGSEFCIPCMQAADIVKEIIAERAGISLIEVNIGERPALAASFGVMSIPVILLIRGGKELGRVSGDISRAKVVAMIEANASAKG